MKNRRQLSPAAVSKRLYWLRRHYGYTQDQMAKMLGIGEMAYSKNERGLHFPSVGSLFALDEKGVSLDWFLFGRGPVFSKEREEKLKRLKELEEHRDTVGGIFDREVGELVETMKRVPLAYHTIMGFFHKFKMENASALGEQKETV